MKKAFLLLAAACLVVACGNKVVAPVEFETLEKTADGVGPEGGPAALEIKIVVPVGEGERQDKVSAGIREIIGQSEAGKTISEAMKKPVEGSLKEIFDAFIAYFPDGVAKGDLVSGAISYQLLIEEAYQNEQAVFFHVTDGIYGNGGPRERYQVVRISDGHLMTGEELTTLTVDDMVKLIKEYGNDQQKENDSQYVEEGYLCPADNGCKLLFKYGGPFYGTVDVPMDVIKDYLTEEGTTLYTAPATAAEPKAEQTAEPAEIVEEAPNTEIGRGDLGLFELRGLVKSCKWKNSEGTNTYTFDENGFWQTQNGKGLKSVFPGGVERDKNGRIKDGWADGFGSFHYTFNDQGLATEINGDDLSRTLTYDADGYVTKGRVDIPAEMGDDEGLSAEHYTLNYTILEKDEIGNWTKRKSSKGTETRTIEYYK